jgi:hypothetical protein
VVSCCFSVVFLYLSPLSLSTSYLFNEIIKNGFCCILTCFKIQFKLVVAGIQHSYIKRSYKNHLMNTTTLILAIIAVIASARSCNGISTCCWTNNICNTAEIHSRTMHQNSRKPYEAAMSGHLPKQPKALIYFPFLVLLNLLFSVVGGCYIVW